MSKDAEYILGVDAGNTKTIALVADMSGRILGAGRAGCVLVDAADAGDAVAIQTADCLAESAGLDVSSELRHQIARTMPAAAFFET